MSKIPYGIRSVKIENFRGIEKLELDFTDPQGNPSDIVVIGGPNGCGKTAVLEACYSLLQGNSPLIPESDPDNAKRRLSPDSIRKGARVFTIAASIQTPSGILERDYDSRNYPFLPHGHADLKFCNLYVSSRRVQNLVGSLSVSLGRSPDVQHYPVVGCPENQRLRDLKQEMLNAKAFESMGGQHTTGYLRFNEIVSPLNAIWQVFYPHSGRQFVVEPVNRNPNSGFDVFLSEPDGPRIPIDSLSAGQIELVTLFGTLLSLKSVSAVIIIDEPELHLDPQWHATLLHELRRFLPNAQFIVATHSPQVFDSVYSYQRHFLVPEDDPRAKAWKAPEKETVPA